MAPSSVACVQAVAVVAAVALLCAGGSAADRTAPVYRINLDLPPDQRWVEVASTHAAAINYTFGYVLNKIKNPVLHGIVAELRAAVLDGGGWSQDQIAEMQGLAGAIGFSLEDVQSLFFGRSNALLPSESTTDNNFQPQVANLFYEFGTLGAKDPSKGMVACTSIVAQQTNGSILHARNQDYSNITVTVEFVRGGKVLYAGTTFLGYIGLPTAMRVGGWSVSCDSRFDGDGEDLFNNIKAAKAGGKTIGIFVRDQMEAASSYDEAIQALNTTLLIAPAYYIVAGTNPDEGAVVTRDREGPDQSAFEGIWSLDYPKYWWRLETNFDHWKVPLDGRREAANKGMAAIGDNNLSLDRMFDVLSTPPVLASDTVYTAKINPATGFYETILRHTS